MQKTVCIILMQRLRVDPLFWKIFLKYIIIIQTNSTKRALDALSETDLSLKEEG
jgi:hypothetical protein